MATNSDSLLTALIARSDSLAAKVDALSAKVGSGTQVDPMQMLLQIESLFATRWSEMMERLSMIGVVVVGLVGVGIPLVAHWLQRSALKRDEERLMQKIEESAATLRRENEESAARQRADIDAAFRDLDAQVETVSDLGAARWWEKEGYEKVKLGDIYYGIGVLLEAIPPYIRLCDWVKVNETMSTVRQWFDARHSNLGGMFHPDTQKVLAEIRTLLETKTPKDVRGPALEHLTAIEAEIEPNEISPQRPVKA